MLKKIITAFVCSTLAAAALSSCGKQIEVSTTESSSKTDSKTSSASSAPSGDITSADDFRDAEGYFHINNEIANFTAPENGEQIIIMKVKDYGEIKIRLFPEYMSDGVQNFVELAKEGYYDGLTFHRVINEFMIQGGDPMGTGMGGESVWGGSFDGGVTDKLIHVAGALAYANSGSTATNGSQFYIVTGSVSNEEELTGMGDYYGIKYSDKAKELYTTIGGAPWLDGNYTVFGQVYDGLDVALKIQKAEVDANSMPMEKIIMESVTVGEYNGEELRWYASDYK